MRQPKTTCTSCSRDTATRPITPSDDCPSTCTICLEPITTTACQKHQRNESLPEPAVAIIQCGHIFGRNCLAQWMRESNTCPICRVEFFEMPKPTLAENMERPLYAMGVYAGAGVLEHFSGLAIRLREQDETEVGAHERAGSNADRSSRERMEEAGRHGRQSVYHA
ncbi:hypothetical protein FB567DRAFT_161537 [Paraphoma chrysanthemicola]|uniref:RING-type domain-containing protein n=1 Tax=Paraphoma chrysanthemicola TaxID=798071 RepID=A0A8K0REB4_9PLEO|nr:hypothetical protein FB567DRAFT_161537 [Paraphoma chrysanthemicola]